MKVPLRGKLMHLAKRETAAQRSIRRGDAKGNLS
jgi:hypothetical protein